jgi:hypothetical protein
MGRPWVEDVPRFFLVEIDFIHEFKDSIEGSADGY